jgi:iron complex outermembrane recepter protein
MRLTFICLLIFISHNFYAQQNISGHILDANTEAPVVGATVYVQKLEAGTISDLDGLFSLEVPSEGKYDLVISSLGYGTRTVEVAIPEEQKIIIRLTPSAIEIEEIIISTPFHQLQSDNVMKVERATIEELTRGGATNFAEGISQIAGVETISTGSGIGKPVIRGLSSNRVLVYTQGVRLENQQFGDEHGLGVSSSGTESVEVIKGPASLLYGSDALGGVLYLNPERYAPADSTAVDMGLTYYTNTLGFEANAGAKTSGEKFRYLIRGNYAAHSDYETGDDYRVTNSRFKEWDLKTGIGFRQGSYKGDLRYNLNSSKIGIPEEVAAQSTSKNLLLPYQEVQNHILSLDNHFYLNNSSLNIKLGYLFNDRKEFEEEHHEEEGLEEEEEAGHEGEEPALEMHLSTFNYDVKYNFPKSTNFETIIGLQGMFQENQNFGEEILIPNAAITDVGLMATSHYHINKFDFQAGLRYDFRNIKTEAARSEESLSYIPALHRDFNSFNGALGAKYNPVDNLTIRLNLASGFRAPNLAELTSNGNHNGANRYEIGNPDLDNEQNYQLDLAVEYRNEHVEIFTNAFYNRIKNYIYLNPTDVIREGDFVYEYIQNNANLYGGEAGFHLHPHPVDWLHIRSSYELVIGKQENGEYLPLIPAQSILNTIKLDGPFNKLLHNSYSAISLKTVLAQNNVGLFETSSKGYSLLNAQLGGTLHIKSSSLELSLSGNNLLNKKYIAHLSRLKQDNILNRGRNITIGGKLTF